MQLVAAEQWGCPPWLLTSGAWESLTPAEQAREKWRWLLRLEEFLAARAEKTKRDLEYAEWRKSLR